jgi:glycosyltransferase involved in cell wall biosynthesis
MVHRVDGPISVYRGHDDGTDQRIWQINQEVADATIFQSHYSLAKHIELGFAFRDPVVILNTPDPALFHANGRVAFDPKRKIRLISTSWSDNPNKGAATYQWLEEHLDWERFDYTFVGRTPYPFKRIRTQPPLPSGQLAEVLRQHDIFITASRHDPCSNALLEALACGLPALYLRSGGHPELVGRAGLGFDDVEETLPLLARLVEGYAHFQAQIYVPAIAEVAADYLRAMQIRA